MIPGARLTRRPDTCHAGSMPGLEAVLRALASPLRAFADPSSRHYGPALLVALVLAVIVGVRTGHARSLGTYLFSKRVWLHRSALLDYQLVFARPVVRLLLTGPLVLSSVLLASRVIALLHRALGPSPRIDVDRTWVVAIFTIGAFVAEDLVRFLLHVACHRIEPLWALHRLHHTAEVMTPFTVHRVHPLESVLNRAGGAVAVGLVAGACGWLFSGPISGWEILGVDALGLVWNMAGGVLRHSEIPLSNQGAACGTRSAPAAAYLPCPCRSRIQDRTSQPPSPSPLHAAPRRSPQ